MHSVSVIENNEENTFEVPGSEPLYDELMAKGKELPHGCLSGSCGACRIEVIDGSENLDAPGVVERDTIEGVRKTLKMKSNDPAIDNMQIRLSCRAKPKGNVKIRPV